MKRILFTLGAVALLAGCNTAGDTSHVNTASQVVYQRVNVPVVVPCPVTKPPRPGDAKTHGIPYPRPTDLGALVDLLLAKLKEWDGPGKYADQADDAIDTCIHPKPPAAK